MLMPMNAVPGRAWSEMVYGLVQRERARTLDRRRLQGSRLLNLAPVDPVHQKTFDRRLPGQRDAGEERKEQHERREDPEHAVQVEVGAPPVWCHA
jgi:hypothetical protein